ncbi:unnamed protein product [Pedinophyceae sp. YPF-701]|nr:unnamed protein product [Pedinophyceae sp. YPF-701]
MRISAAFYSTASTFDTGFGAVRDAAFAADGSIDALASSIAAALGAADAAGGVKIFLYVTGALAASALIVAAAGGLDRREPDTTDDAWDPPAPPRGRASAASASSSSTKTPSEPPLVDANAWGRRTADGSSTLDDALASSALPKGGRAAAAASPRSPNLIAAAPTEPAAPPRPAPGAAPSRSPAEVAELVQRAAERKERESAAVRRRELVERLVRQIERLGTLAVLPGTQSADRLAVEDIVAELERMPPIERPMGDPAPYPVARWGVRNAAPVSADSWGRPYSWEVSSDLRARSVRGEAPPQYGRVGARAGAEEVPCGELNGRWELVYASQGTVVTRSPPARILEALSGFPGGFGVRRISQTLTVDKQFGVVRSDNAAIVGLGPLGAWRISARGQWVPVGWSGMQADVTFDSWSIRPLAWMGLRLDGGEEAPWEEEAGGGPGAPALEGGGPLSLTLPALSLEIPEALRMSAEWVTTYVDGQVRFGRGRSGNLFVFQKVAEPR